jgi:hypothetical protein
MRWTRMHCALEAEIKDLIEPTAWERCVVVNEAQQESMRTVLDQWGK